MHTELRTTSEALVGYRGKRTLDVAVSLTGLLLLSPFLVMLWALVRVSLGSPALFRQQRPGLRGVAFEILKFRSMTDERDKSGTLLSDEDRLTRLGIFLRKTSLDELPELWNVLKGDMSLVGPRPLLMEYLPHYTPREQRRHEVRPGITGLAQVTGRNTIGWTERLECDVNYVESVSLGLDLKILARTVVAVLRRENVAVNTDEVETRLDEERLGSTTNADRQASDGAPAEVRSENGRG